MCDLGPVETMNICWVIAEHAILALNIQGQNLSDAAPTWGSWRHIRGLGIDNAVCYDAGLAQQLIARGYNKISNLYVPEAVWKQANTQPLQAFGGSFDFDVASRDDVVACHLAASQNQVVMLLGFDLENQSDYTQLIYQTINSHPQTQWVLVDDSKTLPKNFQSLTNLTCDQFENVLNLLGIN